jgi:DNA-directed RNA polymerase specialized sigma24 family protein
VSPLERLYRRHREHALAVALRKGAGQDAEDCVQQAYEALARKRLPADAHEGYVVRAVVFEMSRRRTYDRRQRRDVRLTTSLDTLIAAGFDVGEEVA